LAAPFLAVGLYEGLKAWNLTPWTFFVCTVVNAVGAWGFVELRKRRRSRPATLVAAAS
jgi:hypothetical protein